jgi:hypothetical protein
MSNEQENKFPSTAFLQQGHPDADPANGEFVPCPLNQPAYYQKGKGAHAIAPHAHPTPISGYCEHLVLGGCPKDEVL